MNSITRIKRRKEIKIIKNENLFITSESSQEDTVQIGAIGINDNRRYAYMYWTFKLLLSIWVLHPVFPIFETLMSLNFEKNKYQSKMTIFSSLKENSIINILIFPYFSHLLNTCGLKKY